MSGLAYARCTENVGCHQWSRTIKRAAGAPRFGPAFRASTVRLVQREQRRVSAVARDLGFSPSALAR